MTDATYSELSLSHGRLSAGLRAFFRAEPLFAAASLILLAAMLPTGFAAWVDDRTLQGVNVWVKPLKFEFALFVYVGSLAIFAHWLPARFLRSPLYRVYAVAVIVMVVLEMVWIGGAAAFGVASHFNQTSAFMIAVYGFMGFAAVFLTTASLVYAVVMQRHADTGLPPALKRSFVLGLGLVLPLTLVTAGTMSSLGSHAVGVGLDQADRLAIVGWLRDGGDLRVSHFFATHAMHVIPLAGLVITRFGGGQATRLVTGFAVAYTLFTLYTFTEALEGRPFLPGLG